MERPLTRLKLYHKASAPFTRRQTNTRTIASAHLLHSNLLNVVSIRPYLFWLRSPWFHNQQFLLRIGRHVRLAEKSQIIRKLNRGYSFDLRRDRHIIIVLLI